MGMVILDDVYRNFLAEMRAREVNPVLFYEICETLVYISG